MGMHAAEWSDAACRGARNPRQHTGDDLILYNPPLDPLRHPLQIFLKHVVFMCAVACKLYAYESCMLSAVFSF